MTASGAGSRTGAVWLVFATTTVLYLATLAPTFTWGDAADLPIRVWDLEDRLFDLTARDYALHRRVGRLFLRLPVGDIAYRINLMTALFGAATCAAVTWAVLLATSHPRAALAAGLALGVSHSMWLVSVTTEVYTLATFLQVLALGLLLRWDHGTDLGRTSSARPAVGPRVGSLLAFGLVAGLSLSHHLSAVLCLPAYAAFLFLRRNRLRPGPLAGAALLALLGGGFLAVSLARLLRLGGIPALLAFGGEAGSSPPLAALLREAALSTAHLIYQFPAGVLLGGLGLAIALRRRNPSDVLLLLWWGVATAWAVHSRIPDKYNASVLTYPSFAILVGLGVARVLDRPPSRRWSTGAADLSREGPRRARAFTLCMFGALVVLPPLAYAVAPSAVKALRVDIVRARPCPFRDNDWFFLFPPKNGYHGARRYAEAALSAAEPGAVILSDYTLWRPMVYLQRIEKRRPDLELRFVEPLLAGNQILSYLSAETARRPVYLATDAPPAYYNLELVLSRFLLQPHPPIFRVLPR